jgi:hypothetical protein
VEREKKKWTCRRKIELPQSNNISSLQKRKVAVKIRLAYWDVSKYLRNTPKDTVEIQRAFEMIDVPESFRKPYSQYLLSSLDSDFYANQFGDCDELLAQVERVDRKEVENYIFESGGFTQYISKNSVTFEHAIYGVCPHWPLWSCPLSHYKIALQAARDFFALPESLDTELIVELPESDIAKIALFPPKLFENEAAKEASHD